MDNDDKDDNDNIDDDDGDSLDGYEARSGGRSTSQRKDRPVADDSSLVLVPPFSLSLSVNDVDGNGRARAEPETRVRRIAVESTRVRARVDKNFILPPP